MQKKERKGTLPPPGKSMQKVNPAKVPEKPQKADPPGKPARGDKDSRRSSALIHQIFPFIWLVLGILFAVGIVLYVIELHTKPEGHLGGILGYWIVRVLFGIFGYGTYAIPVILFSLAVLWRKTVDKGQLPVRLILSSLTAVIFSAYLHILFVSNGAEGVKYQFGWLWSGGTDLHGGGIIGGILGQALYSALQFTLSSILCIAVLLLLFMFLCGVTPVYVWTKIRFVMRRNSEKRAAARELREVQKVVDAVSPGGLPTDPEKMGKEPPEENGKAKAHKSHREPEDVMPVMTDESLVRDNPAAGKHAEETAELNLEMLGGFSDAPLSKNEKGQISIPETSEGKLTGKDFYAHAMDAEPEKPKAPAQPAKQPEPEPQPQLDEDERIREKFTGEKTMQVGKMESEVETYLAGEENDPEDPSEAQADHASAALPVRRKYSPPPVDLLSVAEHYASVSEEEIMRSMKTLRATLESFHINVQEMNYACGPTVTRYEIRPEAGVRVRQVANLVDDIALGLAKSGVRIEAPIPGKAAIGIEVPNDERETVFLRSLIESSDFASSKAKIPACLGADISGKYVHFDLSKMPHLLIAGATGMGKSVCINCLVISLLYRMSPEDVRLIMVDPKQVEFVPYKNIPHLFVPIITDPKAATAALGAAVLEMEDRFTKIKEVGARDIRGYNEIAAMDADLEKLPYIVIIIDELADLMMTAAAEAEDSICRLAAKARAAGIHLIIGTQRPSVDVIKGTIKSNIPSRIACTVASQVDSKTILDYAGAEKLIGRGDMLYAPVGAMKPIRVQGAFVADAEVERICDFVRFNNDIVQYDEQFLKRMDETMKKIGGKKGADDLPESSGAPVGHGDDKLTEALSVILESGKASTSYVQRRIGVGYSRGAKLLDQLEEMGIIGKLDGSKPRPILINKEEYMEYYANHGCYPGFENGVPGDSSEEGGSSGES